MGYNRSNDGSCKGRKDIETADRRRQRAELNTQGGDKVSIARDIGAFRSTVRKDISALKAQWRLESAEDIAVRLNRELAVRDLSEENLTANASSDKQPAGTRIAAASVRLKEKLQGAKLLGLDAAHPLMPTGVEIARLS